MCSPPPDPAGGCILSPPPPHSGTPTENGPPPPPGSTHGSTRLHGAVSRMVHQYPEDLPSRQGQGLHLADPRGLPKQGGELPLESAIEIIPNLPLQLGDFGAFRWDAFSRR